MSATAARPAPDRIHDPRSTRFRARTSPGEVRSRVEDLRRGLQDPVVGAGDREAVGGSAGAVDGPFTFGGWLVEQVSRLGARVEHAQSMQQAARGRMALRAELAWDDDRRLEALLLADQLARKPEPTLEKLRRTPQGCDLLIARWAGLAQAAGQGQGWTPEQSRLAFDLLGTPPLFREGIEPGAGVDPVALAHREIAGLERRRELARELDLAERRDAEAGLTDDAEVRRLRRFEASLHRRLQWTLELLQGAPARPGPTDDPVDGPSTGPEAEAPAPEADDRSTDPAPAIEAPAIEAPGRSPTRSASRAEGKLKQAETRRQARSRKLLQHRS